MIYEEKNTTREINLHKQEFESYIRERLIKNLKKNTHMQVMDRKFKFR